MNRRNFLRTLGGASVIIGAPAVITSTKKFIQPYKPWSAMRAAHEIAHPSQPAMHGAGAGNLYMRDSLSGKWVQMANLKMAAEFRDSFAKALDPAKYDAYRFDVDVPGGEVPYIIPTPINTAGVDRVRESFGLKPLFRSDDDANS